MNDGTVHKMKRLRISLSFETPVFEDGTPFGSVFPDTVQLEEGPYAQDGMSQARILALVRCAINCKRREALEGPNWGSNPDTTYLERLEADLDAMRDNARAFRKTHGG